MIAIVFGPEYRPARPALLWLLPGLVAIAVGRVMANDVAARGRPGLNLVGSLLGLAVNVTINLLLIPAWGITGAALSSSMSYIIIVAVVLISYSKLSGNAWWTLFVIRSGDIRTISRQLAADLRPRKMQPSSEAAASGK
jgi:O-antigen/teichoic acid export membrane protein